MSMIEWMLVVGGLMLIGLGSFGEALLNRVEWFKTNGIASTIERSVVLVIGALLIWGAGTMAG